MTQMYQFLASGGRIQPLRAVRGVLDPQGKAISRYDDKAEPPQEGDAIAARLVTLALQSTVTSGTARPAARGRPGAAAVRRQDRHQQRQPRQLVRRLHRRSPRGDLGRQRPEQADRPVRRHRRDEGVVGAVHEDADRAAARGRAGPSSGPWLDPAEYATTEADCPGARRAAFVSGYLPSEHKSCQRSSWLDGSSRRRGRAASATAAAKSARQRSQCNERSITR
jgi:penicillin-binding protein 1B